ncbi:uncharacterized protein G2W53_010206 [Senna tora]|uniref:Uncharacterized protein n=1 Tax=Senna tora TaxID=362788 RepID=A0A834X0J2_9FABA|nr:uncharacterized protein G2W53_010206 [Senna tora]
MASTLLAPGIWAEGHPSYLVALARQTEVTPRS